jgi:phage FluMu protein Com
MDPAALVMASPEPEPPPPLLLPMTISTEHGVRCRQCGVVLRLEQVSDHECAAPPPPPPPPSPSSPPLLVCPPVAGAPEDEGGGRSGRDGGLQRTLSTKSGVRCRQCGELLAAEDVADHECGDGSDRPDGAAAQASEGEQLDGGERPGRKAGGRMKQWLQSKAPRVSLGSNKATAAAAAAAAAAASAPAAAAKRSANFDVMLSYTAGDRRSERRLVRALADQLRAEGCSVWFPPPAKGDSIRPSNLQSAVEGARVVVLCMSDEYAACQHCICEYHLQNISMAIEILD